MELRTFRCYKCKSKLFCFKGGLQVIIKCKDCGAMNRAGVGSYKKGIDNDRTEIWEISSS